MAAWMIEEESEFYAVSVCQDKVDELKTALAAEGATDIMGATTIGENLLDLMLMSIRR